MAVGRMRAVRQHPLALPREGLACNRNGKTYGLCFVGSRPATPSHERAWGNSDQGCDEGLEEKKGDAAQATIAAVAAQPIATRPSDGCFSFTSVPGHALRKGPASDKSCNAFRISAPCTSGVHAHITRFAYHEICMRARIQPREGGSCPTAQSALRRRVRGA